MTKAFISTAKSAEGKTMLRRRRFFFLNKGLLNKYRFIQNSILGVSCCCTIPLADFPNLMKSTFKEHPHSPLDRPLKYLMKFVVNSIPIYFIVPLTVQPALY